MKASAHKCLKLAGKPVFTIVFVGPCRAAIQRGRTIYHKINLSAISEHAIRRILQRTVMKSGFQQI